MNKYLQVSGYLIFYLYILLNGHRLWQHLIIVFEIVVLGSGLSKIFIQDRSTWELTKIPIEHNFEFWCIKKAIVFSILKEEKLAYENREICLINSINNFSLVIWKISRRRLPKEALLCHYWIQRYQKIQLDIRALFCVSFQISHHISGCCLLVTGMLLHSQISCKFFQTHEFDLHFDANFSSLGIIEYTFFHINFVLTCYSNKKHFTYSSCI